MRELDSTTENHYFDNRPLLLQGLAASQGIYWWHCAYITDITWFPGYQSSKFIDGMNPKRISLGFGFFSLVNKYLSSI